MNSYIYDKMPARIVGCTSPIEVNPSGNTSRTYTTTLDTWEEDYDYLVMTIFPRDFADFSSYTSVAFFNNLAPLQYIVPKNASEYRLLVYGAYDSSDLNRIYCIEGNTITVTGDKKITLVVKGESGYHYQAHIMFTAYKNNI